LFRKVFDLMYNKLVGRELRIHVFLDPNPHSTKNKILGPDLVGSTLGPHRALTHMHVFFSLIFETFCVKKQINDEDLSYLLFTLANKGNIKLFFIVFPRIVLFRFEAKCKPGLNLNLDIDPDPTKKYLWTRTEEKRKSWARVRVGKNSQLPTSRM
jgi:hypothetical protein